MERQIHKSVVPPDYALKASVLDLSAKNDILKLRSQVDYAFYLKSQGCLEDESPIPFETASFLNAYFSARFPAEWHEAGKINHAKHQRVKRLRAKIQFMLDNFDCAFLTFTFTDFCLDSTSDRSRRKYVQRALNSLDVHYVGNQDFGKKNGREHYHAVVACVPTDEQLSAWSQYGFYKVKKIRNTKDDVTRLSKYVAKLTNHAIKETNKRSVMLYSRKHKFPARTCP